MREHWSPLYNGNIAHSVNTLQPFGTWSANGGQAQVLAQVYAYDQLNRLQKSRGIIGLGASNNWEGITDANAWRYVSEYGYDANGNITDCDRYTGDTGLRYDVLRYKYQKQQGSGRLLRNRLYHVHSDHDNLATTDIGDYADDLANFNDPHNTNGTINTANPYGYDALGNLARNTHDGISAIDWTVAGKVKNVHRMGGSALPKLQFGYGASGQRIMKQVGVPGQDAGAYREHYIRDAQGNIMATYRYTNASSASLKLSERPIYGSSRLGSLRKEVEVYNAPTSISPGANPVQLVELNYELTDHLGNVSAVVTGRLLTNLFGITPCQAELVSAQGYEPFGSLLPGRNYNSGSYRFGFNGMEKDDEVNGGIGLSYTTEFRQYDSRIGRWLSIDPKTSKFAMFSPYESFHNNPIVNTDPKGDCPECGMFAKFFRNVFGIDALPGNEFTYPGTERKRGTWFYDYGDGFRMNSTDRNGIVHRDNFMAIRQEWNVPLLHGTPIDPVSEIRVVSAREVSVNVLVNNVLPKFGTPGVGVSRPNESRSAELVVYGTITTTTADATTGEVLSTVTQDYFVVYALNHERGGYLTTGDIIRKGITARDTPIPYSAVIQGAIKDAVMNNSGAAKRGLDAIQQQMYEDGNGVQQIIEQDTRSDQEAEYTRPPR